MPRNKIRYFVVKQGAGGTELFYWQPNKELRDKGWPPVRLPSERAAAEAKAEALNAELDAWRAGEMAKAPQVKAGTVTAMIHAYLAGHEFRDLRDSTRRVYRQALKLIETWAEDTPVGRVATNDLRQFYEELYWKDPEADPRVLNTPAQANTMVRTARLLWKWGIAHGYAHANPGRDITIRDAREPAVVWPAAAVKHFVRTADELGWFSVGTAVMLNEWAGQRQADILMLPKARFRNGALAVTQRKTGARVLLPIHLVPELMTRLEQEAARNSTRADGDNLAATTLLVCEATGKPWNQHYFRQVFGAIRAAAAKGDAARGVGGVPFFKHDEGLDIDDEGVRMMDLDFMHLRHTAVSRNAIAGSTTEQIASITGHSLAQIEHILERYFVRSTKLAEGAFKKRIKAERGE